MRIPHYPFCIWNMDELSVLKGQTNVYNIGKSIKLTQEAQQRELLMVLDQRKMTRYKVLMDIDIQGSHK
jgi:hypothetical protein